MIIRYDPEADALSITFIEATVTTQHIAEGVAIDYDKDNHIAGIEILDAKKRFGDSGTLKYVVLEQLGLSLPA